MTAGTNDKCLGTYCRKTSRSELGKLHFASPHYAWVINGMAELVVRVFFAIYCTVYHKPNTYRRVHQRLRECDTLARCWQCASMSAGVFEKIH